MTILYNGIVYSGDKFYEAIAFDGRTITYVGDNAGALAMTVDRGPQIDLQGKLVLPGFIDSHAHGAIFNTMLLSAADLTEGKSVAEYLDILRQFVDRNPDLDVIQGVGWFNTLFDDSGPAKELLDAISQEKPIILKSTDYHSVWANTKAIETAGITAETPDPRGGTIEKNPDGSVRGTFREEAQNFFDSIKPEIDVELVKKAVRSYQEQMVKYGITSVYDAMIDLESVYYRAFQALADNDGLLIKTVIAYTSDPKNHLHSLSLYKQHGPRNKNKFYEGRHVKIFVDGVVEGTTALLKEPYCHVENYCGEAIWDTKILNEFCAEADNLGYDLHFHVMGDGAVSQMLDALEFVNKNNAPGERRPVAAHMQILDRNDLERMKKANLSISSNPYWFVKAPGYYKNIEVPFLGESRASKEYPMKTLFDHGLVVASASDYSVTPVPYPVLGMKTAIERCMPYEDPGNPDHVLGPEERVDITAMVESFTRNGAYTMRLENLTGELKPGKLADIVVLDKNIFEIPSSEFESVKVDMTISEGKIVYRGE